MAEKPPENEDIAPGTNADTASPSAQTDGGDESAVTPEDGTPPITIRAQYIKDLSFEAPTAPSIFSVIQQKPPDIDVNINIDHSSLEGGNIEVTLEFEVRCSTSDDLVFIMELQYSGVFTVNVPDKHFQPVLFVECPRLLFPFARNILASVSREAGFPPLMLGPVDFVAMYQNQLQHKDATDGDAEQPQD